MDLRTPTGAAASFAIRYAAGPPATLAVSEAGAGSRTYVLPDHGHGAHVELFSRLAADFRLRPPLAATPPDGAAEEPRLRAVLTEPVDPRILYGYGDPCVVRVAEHDYRLLVTSNDAPDAFPILASPDLESWRLQGFVFPQGCAPAWAICGPDVSDFWAPELHQVGDEWWVCFTARTHDRSLAIGIARSGSPDGPFTPDEAPIVTGGVIDAHIVLDAEARPWLVWKQDDNDRWPRALAALLHERPDLTSSLFDGLDARTAAFAASLWPWVRELEPMRQFFLLQLLVEAVAEDLDGFAGRLRAAAPGLAARQREQAEAVLSALRTRIWAQRIAPDGRRLEGEPSVILENDLRWEGHLIEGVWITREGGRFHLLYAGNDFSTARYGIGAAVADQVTGPYRKQDEVFLASTASWWGPGHPSVVGGPDGRPRMFLHGFRPGQTGYKAFRALLTAPLAFAAGRLEIA